MDDIGPDDIIRLIREVWNSIPDLTRGRIAGLLEAHRSLESSEPPRQSLSTPNKQVQGENAHESAFPA
jgi:hypothetical protein